MIDWICREAFNVSWVFSTSNLMTTSWRKAFGRRDFNFPIFTIEFKLWISIFESVLSNILIIFLAGIEQQQFSCWRASHYRIYALRLISRCQTFKGLDTTTVLSLSLSFELDKVLNWERSNAHKFPSNLSTYFCNICIRKLVFYFNWDSFRRTAMMKHVTNSTWKVLLPQICISIESFRKSLN